MKTKTPRNENGEFMSFKDIINVIVKKFFW